MVRVARTVTVALAAGLLVLPPAARAAQPAALFNADGQLHAPACVQLAVSPAALRFADGAPTGFELTNGLSFNDGRCPAGTVRLDYHEVFPTGAGPLVFHRGGNGYADEQNTKYGQLVTGDIATPLGDPVPSLGGRGAPCAALAPGPAHRVDVRTIPAEMHYKHPSELPSGSNRGSSFEHYGDPGADQGARTDIHYSYLLWSFVNTGGGGIVRTLLAPGQVVRPCDVEPITMSSWDREGNVNGSVTARYVRSLVGACHVYGWMVWSHSYAPDGPTPVPHATTESSPPAESPPPPECPTAAPAAPPTVTTGDAAPSDTAASIAGTVNPEGTRTTYRFEYGTTPSLGSSTEERPISVAIRTNAVSAQLTGLQPETTYHYRIVATGSHGRSEGPTRSLTTLAPPPPPPPPEPVALSGLRLTPSAMKRSRHRLGTSARISFALSRPAAVTFTFTRATTGMRVGKKCRKLPKRGLPRGRRRCTRWATVPGSLGRLAPAGPGSLRFGGWIGRRALSAGRYRVQALPADGGPAATARLAGFRIR